MGEVSIEPKEGLTKPADPKSGEKSQFALYTDDWLQLQSFVGVGVELPITKGNFEAKYGSFGQSKTITDCIDAMKDVNEASSEFGDPKSLRASLIENPGLLATDKPPEQIYTHTVWMGQKVHQTASTIASGYESVLEALPTMPSGEQVTNIKAYLFDQTMGPIPLSEKMSTEIGELIKKLGKFEQKMNEYNEKMSKFTGSSSNMIQEVDKSIGSLSQKIKDLEKSRDDAYEAWKNFTIAAVTSSIGCLLIGGLLAPFTGGVSLLVGGAAGLAAGVGLGIKAATMRAKYNEYCKQISSETVTLKKKQRLRADLGGLDLQMKKIGPAMSSFLKNLQTIQGVWVQMNTDMIEISKSVNEGNIGTLPFLVKAKANKAVDSWKDIDHAAKQFTVQSLIDYDVLAFGQQMPEKKAA